MSDNNREISIVTVNYNGIECTVKLLDSLKRYLDLQKCPVIVVDNGSSADEASEIMRRYPDITVIRSSKNLGFAGGNNLGIERAVGRNILLINNDTEIKDDSLLKLVQRLDSSPTIGAVSPKILFYYYPDTIQYAGYTPLSLISLRNRGIGSGEKDNGQYNSAGKTAFLHGAAMMIKREALEKAGMMPELFFLYYEEFDWCESIKSAGYEVWYDPACSVYHKESMTVGAASPLKIRFMVRNRLIYAIRNRKFPLSVLSVVYQLAVAIPKQIFLSIVKGRFRLAAAAINGASAFIFADRKVFSSWKRF
jgi:GT2 family glycosyltransferase